MMIVSGILFLSVCLLLDHLVIEKFIYKLRDNRKKLPTKTAVDNDVEDEAEKIKRMTNSEMKNSNLALIGLSKFYGNNLAVNQLYLGVNTSECFGLLVSEWNEISKFIFHSEILGGQRCREDLNI